MPETRVCQSCGLPFIFVRRRMRLTRKYCSRDCYRAFCQKDFDKVPYPMIWYKGKREYLHRVIYMEHYKVALTPEQLIHHKDENPFNREPDNLELIEGDARAEHLKVHDYFRGRKQKPASDYEYDPDFPF